MSKASTPWVVLLLLLAGQQIFSGLWIIAKAQLAQVLIEKSWRAADGERPWPWADTWAVSRMSVPAAGVDLIVLEGEQGNALAFGPGHLRRSALPGQPGLSIIGGHRDTHFRFLKDLEHGARIVFEDRAGQLHHYRVTQKQVHDSRHQTLWAEGDAVLLVTCYPFDSLRSGGPLRYVVTARQELNL